jgi:hypothetical protein
MLRWCMSRAGETVREKRHEKQRGETPPGTQG